MIPARWTPSVATATLCLSLACSGTAHAACPATFRSVMAEAETALVAFEQGEVAAFTASQSRLMGELVCIESLLESDELVQIHLVTAIGGWLRDDLVLAQTAIVSIRALDPDFDLRLALAVSDTDLVTLAEAAAAPGESGPRVALPVVPWSTWRIEAKEGATDAPEGRPVLAQLVDTRSGQVRTWYLQAGGVPPAVRGRSESTALRGALAVGPAESELALTAETPSEILAAPVVFVGGGLRTFAPASGVALPSAGGPGVEVAGGLVLGRGWLAVGAELGYAELRARREGVAETLEGSELFPGDLMRWGRAAVLGCVRLGDTEGCAGPEARVGVVQVSDADAGPGQDSLFNSDGPALGIGGVGRLTWWPDWMTLPVDFGLSLALGGIWDGVLGHSWATGSVALRRGAR